MEKYETPEMEIVYFQEEDIIRTSNDPDIGGGDQGEV